MSLTKKKGATTKVAVYGPGALGCLIAARLVQSGEEVVLVDHCPERAARLSAKGLTVDKGAESITVPITAIASAPQDVSLCIICVKSRSTKSLQLSKNIPVLSIQNGIGNIETLCNTVGTMNVLAGVTNEAATLIEEGRTRHVASGLTKIGAWTSCPTNHAVALLAHAGFQVELTESPGQAIWEKVVVNAGINPLTALTNLPNGRLLEIPEIRELLRDLVVEAVKVASTEGYRFPCSMVEYTEQVCRDTRDNLSSMLQDIRAGKPTEIEAISGEIVRRALLTGLPCPRTRVVYQLIRGIEQR